MNEPRRGRGRPPQVPPVPREPIGRDRAGASRGPKRQGRPTERPERPERPDIPDDAEVELPVRARKEIDRLVNDRTRAREVKVSLSLGTIASEEDDHQAARRYLAWAKHLAPRAAIVREALGIALYRAGDLRAALAELQAYRRLSGSEDQNHLIADCLRAEGRDLDRAIEVAMALVEDNAADMEHRVEAAIVAAAIQLSLSRPERAASILGTFLSGPRADEVAPESTVRLLWVAADAAEAAGDVGTAVRSIERLLSIDRGYPDAQERLTLLRASGHR